MKNILITIAAVLLVGCGSKEAAAPNPEATEEMNAEKIRQIYLRQGIDIDVKDDITGNPFIDGDWTMWNILTLCIPIPFIIILFGFFQSRHNRLKKIKSEWSETEAVVTNIRQEKYSYSAEHGNHTKMQDVYELEYTFSQNKYKNSYRDKTDNALKRSIKGTKTGDAISIYFNPENPQQIMVF